MTISQVIGLFCLYIVSIVGLIFVWQSFARRRRRRIMEVGVPTTAEVVSVKEVTPEGGRTSYQITVEFDDHHGNRVRGSFGSFTRLKRGTWTPVTFDPRRPKRLVATDAAVRDNPNRAAQMRTVWIIGGGLVVFGIVLIIGRLGDPI